MSNKRINFEEKLKYYDELKAENPKMRRDEMISWFHSQNIGFDKDNYAEVRRYKKENK